MSLLPSGAIESAGYDINNSLRFRSSATAYLSRTPGTAGNRQKWTWSGWVKRGALSDTMLFHCQISSTDKVQCRIDSNNNIAFLVRIGNVSGLLITSRVLRDPSSWYHIMFVCDTTQSTATTQFKIYVNGVEETSFSSSSATTQNGNSAVNSTNSHQIGYDQPNAGSAFDGYLAETYLIDGQALTPSSFGETDTITGIWKPKKYTGTYGTNGFYLKFSDIATTSGSNAGLGKDFSGNTNYWTTNNISVTSGTTYDAMTDSPTNTSATVANYPVMTPAYIPRGSYTLSEANLKCSGAYASSNYPRIMSSMGMTSGKYYWEYVGATFPATESCSIGIKEVSSTYPSATGGLGAVSGEIGLFNTGRLDNNGSTTNSFSSSFTTGDVIGMAFDATNGTLNYYKNGSALGSQITGIAAGTYAPAFDCLSTSQTVWNVNYGQRPFAQTPPTGYVALNTYNLPTPTILQGNKYMDATLYTGDGASSRTITGVNFQPDFSWIKVRSTTYNHREWDAVRGAGNAKGLYTNLTNAEGGGGQDDNGYLSAFNSDGFSLASGSSGIIGVNQNAATYVAWLWKAGGSTSSNTSGSITSTVSVNTTAGFSIVTYTGNGTSNATVGHGLGVVPKMIVYKRRNDVGNWIVHHTSLGNNGSNYAFLEMNTTAATQTVSSYLPVGGLSSTTFMTGTTGSINASGGTYVAYCWAAIPGFSAFGSYTGNGSSDGSFIFTGFTPKFIMIKCTDTAGTAWVLYDTTRDTYNQMTNILLPNSSSAELSGYSLDVLSNGFKHRQGGGDPNASGRNYIYACFASNPMKVANAR